MARRVVAKVEHHAGELFPRVGFIVTNLSLPSRAVVRFYNKRGTSEQWIKEGKQAVKMTRLSCHRFRSNEVRLSLERDRLQSGEPVAANGAAEEHLRAGP
ncbi:MAG TPA: transposase [Terriglobia bacterium]|nr:transposase [Terriglobia bacterium]